MYIYPLNLWFTVFYWLYLFLLVPLDPFLIMATSQLYLLLKVVFIRICVWKRGREDINMPCVPTEALDLPTYGHCEPPDEATGNRTCVLWKSGKCHGIFSSPLSFFFFFSFLLLPMALFLLWGSGDLYLYFCKVFIKTHQHFSYSCFPL